MGDPHARHATLIHFPIVLSLFSAALLIALAATRFRSAALKWTCVAVFAVGAVGAYMAEQAGKESEEHVEEEQTLTAEAEADLERHEDLGEGGWKWPAIAAVLSALTFVKPTKWRVAAGAAALVGGLGAAGWVGLTADAGGTLVYVHGLGTPSPGGGGHSHADGHTHPSEDPAAHEHASDAEAELHDHDQDEPHD